MLPERATLEEETRSMKTYFSLLLGSITSELHHLLRQDYKLAIDILSSYDAGYLESTKNCEGIDDVIAVLEANITFLDYELLLFIAYEIEDIEQIVRSLPLSFRIRSYVAKLESYLQERVFKKHGNKVLMLDNEMSVHPGNKKKICQLRSIAEKEAGDTVKIDASYLNTFRVSPVTFRVMNFLENGRN